MGHRDFKTTLIYADYRPSAHEAEFVERAFGRNANPGANLSESGADLRRSERRDSRQSELRVIWLDRVVVQAVGGSSPLAHLHGWLLTLGRQALIAPRRSRLWAVGCRAKRKLRAACFKEEHARPGDFRLSGRPLSSKRETHPGSPWSSMRAWARSRRASRESRLRHDWPATDAGLRAALARHRPSYLRSGHTSTPNGDSRGSANEREGRCRSIYRGSATRRRLGPG